MFSCLLVLQSPGLALSGQICLCLYSHNSHISQNDISLCIVWEVLKCCYSAWVSFRQGDISAGECLKSLDIMEREKNVCFASVVVYWSYRFLPPFLSPSGWLLPLSRFSCLIQVSHTLCVLLCPKQTHTCAARVMVATSEGSVLGLYLEL